MSLSEHFTKSQTVNIVISITPETLFILKKGLGQILFSLCISGKAR